MPSPALYPHQWSWDSAFTAIGLAPAHQHRAQLELATLLAAQWPDGRIPHIVFDPDTPADAYFPGPRFWAAGTPRPGCAARPDRAAAGARRAAWEVYRLAPDREAAAGFLRRAYEPLCAWHAYLLARRDRGRGGLAAGVHPWVTGMDNSPAWDAALAHLGGDAAPGRAHATGPAARARHAAAGGRGLRRLRGARLRLPRRRLLRRVPRGTAVEDPLFNGLLAWSEEAMARIAAVVGADHAAHTARAHRVGSALVARLYDPDAGMFFPRDLAAGRPVPAWSAAGLAVLVAPGLPATVSARVSAHATGGRFGPVPELRGGSGDWLLPSSDRTAATYDPQRYWRGPPGRT